MLRFALPAGVTVLFVCGLLWAEQKDSNPWRWAFKPVASVGFIAAALAAGWPASPFGWAMVSALVLSFWGDVFLIPRATAYFTAGLAAFLLGHVGFGVAFAIRGLSAWALVALPIVAIIAWIVHRWLHPHVPRRLRIPVLAYIGVICTMVVAAVGTVGHRPDGQGLLLLGAAVTFFVSDLAVARNRFVSPGFLNRLWGLPLYYGAQLLFAWALVGSSFGG